MAHNAITGDRTGVFNLYDPENSVTSYQIPLIGGQQVKLYGEVYSGPARETWYAGAASFSTARKIDIPRSGVKTLDLTTP